MIGFSYTVGACTSHTCILNEIKNILQNNPYYINDGVAEQGGSSTVSGSNLIITRGGDYSGAGAGGSVTEMYWCNSSQTVSVTPSPSPFTYTNCSGTVTNSTVSIGTPVYICSRNLPTSPDSFVTIAPSNSSSCPTC